jgi:hypothetical protein
MLPRLLAYRYPSGETMPDHDVISECMGHMYVYLLWLDLFFGLSSL